MLDQTLFLSHAYAHTKDGRKSTPTADSLQNLTWRKELFFCGTAFSDDTTKRTRQEEEKEGKCGMIFV